MRRRSPPSEWCARRQRRRLSERANAISNRVLELSCSCPGDSPLLEIHSRMWTTMLRISIQTKQISKRCFPVSSYLLPSIATVRIMNSHCICLQYPSSPSQLLCIDEWSAEGKESIEDANHRFTSIQRERRQLRLKWAQWQIIFRS